MSLTMYDISVPVFRQILGSLSGVLDKAIAHCDAKGIDPQTLVGAQLAPDMLPLAFQMAMVVNHSAGAVARLQGEAFARPEGLDSLAAMKASLTQTLAALDAVKPADLDGAAAREVVLENPRGDRRFTGQNYLLSFALPNFFFHAATGYDILRAQGVEVGKRDFLGQLALAA
jgi:hypothetical protein